MAIGTTRLVSVNYAVSGLTLMLAPVPGGLVGYPASNLLKPDRNLKFQWDVAVPGDLEITLDIGTGKAVRVVGVAGAAVVGGFPNNIAWQAAFTWPNPVVNNLTTNTTNALLVRATGSFVTDKVKVGQRITGANFNAGATVLLVTPLTVTMSQNANANATLTATATFSDRVDVCESNIITGDLVTILPAAVTYRYWFPNIQFASFGLWSLGKFVLGTLVDFGIAFSPGSSETIIRQRVHNRSVSGAMLSTTTGPNRKALSYSFNSIPLSLRDVLVAAVASAPFLIITPYGEVMEVDTPADGLTVVSTWGAPELFDVQLNVESLP